MAMARAMTIGRRGVAGPRGVPTGGSRSRSCSGGSFAGTRRSRRAVAGRRRPAPSGRRTAHRSQTSVPPVSFSATLCGAWSWLSSAIVKGASAGSADAALVERDARGDEGDVGSRGWRSTRSGGLPWLVGRRLARRMVAVHAGGRLAGRRGSLPSLADDGGSRPPAGRSPRSAGRRARRAGPSAREARGCSRGGPSCPRYGLDIFLARR